MEVPGLLCLQPSQLDCSCREAEGQLQAFIPWGAALGSPQLPAAPCQADTPVPLLTWGFFCFCDKTVIAGQIEIKTRSLECAQPDWYLFWGRGARGGGGSDVNWPSPAPSHCSWASGPVATAGFGCLPAAQLCLQGQVPQTPCAGSLGFPGQGRTLGLLLEPQCATNVASREVRFLFFLAF